MSRVCCAWRLCVLAVVLGCASAYTVDCNHEYTDCDNELNKMSEEEQGTEQTTTSMRLEDITTQQAVTTTMKSTPTTEYTITLEANTESSKNQAKPRLLNLSVDELQSFANALHNKSKITKDSKTITDLSDINLDDDDEITATKTDYPKAAEKTFGDFYSNLHNNAPFNPLMHVDKTSDESEEVCKDRGLLYKIGEKLERGCEETCVCVAGGVFECHPRCQQPYVKKGRRLNDPLCFESPVDECCSIVACATGNGDAKVSRLEVCRHENKTYQIGAKWDVGCEKICTCEKADSISCKPRCAPLPPSDKCINVQDPNDACCEVQVCDVSQDVHEEPTDNSTSLKTTPRTHVVEVKRETTTSMRPLVLPEPIGSVKVLLNNSVQVNLIHPNDTKDPIHLLLSSDGGESFFDVELRYDNLILDLPGGRDYILKTKETGTKFNFTITSSSPSLESEDEIANVSKDGCYHDGKFYAVGEEFHIGCEELCECTGPETRECAALVCPAHVGLELVWRGCVHWAPPPPASPPNCCPRSARCLSDGTCQYKGMSIPNWSEVPIELSGCEERCFCENGELDCQQLCSVPSELPPQTLRCPPHHRPALVNVSDDDCCKQWACVSNTGQIFSISPKHSKVVVDHLGGKQITTNLPINEPSTTTVSFNATTTEYPTAVLQPPPDQTEPTIPFKYKIPITISESKNNKLTEEKEDQKIVLQALEDSLYDQNLTIALHDIFIPINKKIVASSKQIYKDTSDKITYRPNDVSNKVSLTHKIDTNIKKQSMIPKIKLSKESYKSLSHEVMHKLIEDSDKYIYKTKTNITKYKAPENKPYKNVNKGILDKEIQRTIERPDRVSYIYKTDTNINAPDYILRNEKPVNKGPIKQEPNLFLPYNYKFYKEEKDDHVATNMNSNIAMNPKLRTEVHKVGPYFHKQLSKNGYDKFDKNQVLFEATPIKNNKYDISKIYFNHAYALIGDNKYKILPDNYKFENRYEVLRNEAPDSDESAPNLKVKSDTNTKFSALDLDTIMNQMEVDAEINRNLERAANKAVDNSTEAGIPKEPSQSKPQATTPPFLPTIPSNIQYPHEAEEYDQPLTINRPPHSTIPGSNIHNLPIPPVQQNFGEENKKLTVISIQSDSPTSVKMLFGLPSVLVGLKGSVDLRYTDKLDADIPHWYSQIFAPADEILTTSRLEFKLAGLKPSTTYKIRGKLYLHNLPTEPESDIYTIKTLDLPSIEEKRREINSRLSVTDVNDTMAHISWRHFTEDELQYIDGIQVRYRPVGTPIYLMTELLHHSRSSAQLQELRPGSRYEASLVLVPPPRAVVELFDPASVEFTTSPHVDPYNWSVTLEAHAVGSEAAEVWWRGVPVPAERWVRVYRAAHSCGGVGGSGVTRIREHDHFRLASRDQPNSITLTGLQPDTRCRIWLELFLTNGKVKTSNVLEINTKPLDTPEPIDNVIEASSIAGGRTGSSNSGDYYGALVVVGVVAALGALTSLLLLLIVVRRHRPRSVHITPVPTAPRESSLPPYDNPAFKLELQQETMDL